MLCLIAVAMLCVSVAVSAVEEKHPAQVSQVTAEGEAPAGLDGAREKAIADALRNAVMKGIGVYVDSTTVGRDYEAVREEILMKSSGFATLDDVLSSWVTGDLLKVRIKATVSNRPLAERLKALGLTRQWTVGVVASDPAVETSICRQLMSAGFRVIDEAQRKRILRNAVAARALNGDASSLRALGREYDVDIIVTGQARADYVDQDEYGGVMLYRSRGRMDARAYYTDTGELLSATDSTADSLDQSKDLSAEDCLKKVGAKIGTVLANDLMVAPAAMVQYMTVKITGFNGVMAVMRLEEAVRDLPGVTQVKRQRYSGGVLEMSVYVKSDYREELPDMIESCAVGRKLGVAIDSWSKTYVQGRLTKG
ncbi:MAG: hypothetical protein ACYC64_09270 [Armatimonadota bacterium]